MDSVAIILGLGFASSVITFILMRQMEGARLFARRPRVEQMDLRIAPSALLPMTVVKPPKVQPQVTAK